MRVRVRVRARVYVCVRVRAVGVFKSSCFLQKSHTYQPVSACLQVHTPLRIKLTAKHGASGCERIA